MAHHNSNFSVGANRDRLHRAFFFVSLFAMTLLLSTKGNFYSLAVSLVIASICAFFLAFKSNIIARARPARNWRTMAISVISAAFIGYHYIRMFQQKLAAVYLKVPSRLTGLVEAEPLHNAGILVSWILGLSAMYAIFRLTYHFWGILSPMLANEYAQCDRTDKTFFAAGFTVMAASICLLYTMTNAFYLPSNGATIIPYDVIFTTDTGSIVSENAYLSIHAQQNDIRQPLFAVFTTPFAAIATALSNVLFFTRIGYPLVIAMLQCALLLITLILLARIVKLQGNHKTYFLILCVISYPVLLFSINLEQYVFSVFWLVLFLRISSDETRDNYFIMTAAAGSIITSSVAGLFTKGPNNLVAWFKYALHVSVWYLILLAIFGRIPLLFDAAYLANQLSAFTGKEADFIHRVLQFSCFIKTCFIAPATFATQHTGGHISFQMQPVHNLDWAGCIIGLMCIASFWMHRNERWAQISFGWVLYSFVILCLVGWGTPENGLVLYTLYFSWAYISLVFKFFLRLYTGHWIVSLFFSACIVLVAIHNIEAIIKIIAFSINNYPA